MALGGEDYTERVMTAQAAPEAAPESEKAFEAALMGLTAGVSGSARINPALQRPVMVARGDGPRLFDLDGKSYLDFHMGFGSTLLGHNHPAIRRAIQAALEMGVVAGSETVYQGRLAAQLTELIPAAESVRYANSGSEATQVAIRMARAYTGRLKILKFSGHFHGLHDHVLYSAHPPRHAPERGIVLSPLAESAGMPPELAELVVVCQWNDTLSVERAFEQHRGEVAAAICEPVNYNAGCIPPRPEFLPFLRGVTQREGTLLLFDEVLSGFRTGVSCMQGHYGVAPDVCVLAKAVANGVPLAVVAGDREVMRTLAPEGGAAHSGTYSGHLFGVMAALASLEELSKPGVYEGPAGVFAVAERLYSGLREVFRRRGVRCRVQGLGARFGLYFGVDADEEVWEYNQVAGHDARMLVRLIGLCLERGLYFHGYEMALGHHGFSTAHTLTDVDWTLDRIDDACAHLSRA